MDHRRRIRVESRKDATVEGPGGSVYGQVVNVSLKGCLVEFQEGSSPEQGTAVDVTIHLEEGAPELDVHVRGAVARAEPNSVAVDFTEISADSFPHLFRLVQYNAPDPEEVEGELGTSAFEEPPGG